MRHNLELLYLVPVLKIDKIIPSKKKEKITRFLENV